NTSQFQILEQNFDGLANSPAKLRWDNYSGLTHFIVPPTKTSTSSSNGSAKPKTNTNKKSTPKTKKRKKMIVAGHGYNDLGAVVNGTNERDFIRNNIIIKIKSNLNNDVH